MKSKKQIRHRNKSKKFRRKLMKGGRMGLNDGHTPLHKASYDGDMKKVNELIDEGANINAEDVIRMTPLHYSCINGHLNVINTLLDMGADVNARDDIQSTPLHYACNGHMDVFMTLVNRGADVNAENVHGYAPIECLGAKGKKQINEMINSNLRSTMSSMIPRIEQRDAARRILGLNEDVGGKIASFLGGKRKTKKRKTRRRKTRKH